MNEYLLIESRDPFDSADCTAFQQLGIELAKAGHRVRLLLIQNGVLVARPMANVPSLETMLAAGVDVFAEDFSLQERGIDVNDLCRGVGAGSLNMVIEALAAGYRVMWH